MSYRSDYPPSPSYSPSNPEEDCVCSCPTPPYTPNYSLDINDYKDPKFLEVYNLCTSAGFEIELRGPNTSRFGLKIGDRYYGFCETKPTWNKKYCHVEFYQTCIDAWKFKTFGRAPTRKYYNDDPVEVVQFKTKADAKKMLTDFVKFAKGKGVNRKVVKSTVKNFAGKMDLSVEDYYYSKKTVGGVFITKRNGEVQLVVKFDKKEIATLFNVDESKVKFEVANHQRIKKPSKMKYAMRCVKKGDKMPFVEMC